jgi:hypothetical protein
MTNKKESVSFDHNKVDEFFDDYRRATGKFRSRARCEVLDKRIEDAALSLYEKIEVIKMLSPHGSPTGPRRELRMERLICSIGHENLSWFKFAIDYDGDYKDMEEYVFHDIDDEDSQGTIVDHLKSACKSDDEVGTKVLTDVDDTLYANLMDERYPKKTFYPGVLDLYEALNREPHFPLDLEPPCKNRIPITTLSARPNPVAGTLEEGSLESLVEHTKGRLCPTGLSGKVVSSVIGTLETLGRKALPEFVEDFDRMEQEIGIVKFNNFKRYAKIYPEYRYVFFGDSGQADALTADLMLEGSGRVSATLIHDLRQSKTDRKAANPTFRKVTKEAQDRMIVFRNHIDAANQAFDRFGGDLLSASALAKVTKAALDEFCGIKAWEDESARQMLVEQYREDAQRSVRLLESHHEDVKAVRESLNRL